MIPIEFFAVGRRERRRVTEQKAWSARADAIACHRHGDLGVANAAHRVAPFIDPGRTIGLGLDECRWRWRLTRPQPAVPVVEHRGLHQVERKVVGPRRLQQAAQGNQDEPVAGQLLVRGLLPNAATA